MATTNSLLDPPEVNQESFTGSFKSWLNKAWRCIQNLQGVAGSTTINGNLAVTGNETVGGNITITGNETVSGNITVTGIVTDAQTYTRNLGIYHGLLGE